MNNAFQTETRTRVCPGIICKTGFPRSNKCRYNVIVVLQSLNRLVFRKAGQGGKLTTHRAFFSSSTVSNAEPPKVAIDSIMR